MQLSLVCKGIRPRQYAKGIALELRLLRYFLAVAEELHFARAADRLHIEQSPLSRAIKELESELNARLFDRTTRGTVLTWPGEVLRDHAQRLFIAEEQARIAVSSAAAGFRGRLRVALSDGIQPHALTALLARSREEEPEVLVGVSEVTLQQQIKGLAHDLYDVGFALSDKVEKGLKAQAVWRTTLIVAVPARHPLLACKYASLDEVLCYPLVLFSTHSHSGLHGQVAQYLATTGKRPIIAEYVCSQELMLTLVAAGYGVGLTSEASMATYHNADVIARPIAAQPPMLTTYLVLRDTECSEQLQRFTDRAQRIFPEILL